MQLQVESSSTTFSVVVHLLSSACLLYYRSVGFFLIFCAFNTAMNLESTVVTDTQLVNASNAILYALFTLMTIVAPKVVSLLGPRM